VTDNHTRTKILTDHQSLRYLKDTKVPTKRLAHWIAGFGTYDLDIQYRLRPEATVPDPISRRRDFIGTDEAYQHQFDPIQFNLICNVYESDWEEAMIRYFRTGEIPVDSQLRGAVLRNERNPPSSFKLYEDNPNETEVERASLKRSSTPSEFVPQQGSLLYKVHDNKKEVPYLPPQVRDVYLERIHNDYGHLGWPALNGVLETRVWWPSIEKDVQAKVHSCPNCIASKGPATGQSRGPQLPRTRRYSTL
jgi:hypothetical protein